jgi:hypothetical protein
LASKAKHAVVHAPIIHQPEAERSPFNQKGG